MIYASVNCYPGIFCLFFFVIAEASELETSLKKLLGFSDDSMTVVWFFVPSAIFSWKQ